MHLSKVCSLKLKKTEPNIEIKIQICTTVRLTVRFGNPDQAADMKQIVNIIKNDKANFF